MNNTAQQMRRVDKKARRRMNHLIRKTDATIEGVITATTGTLRDVVQRPINTKQLYKAAQRDMGKRTKLGQAHRDGDVQAGKARRKLNDWELATKPAGPATAWAPKGGRRAVGKCDAEAVQKLNKAKRG